MYDYKIISKLTIKKWTTDLGNFYKKYYKKGYVTVFENTAFISICVKDGEIIGAVRVISDLKRFALLVDLRVDALYQKQGIATTITKNILKKLIPLNIDHINLVTVQKPVWLKKFYTKLGFVEIMDSAFLEYNKYSL